MIYPHCKHCAWGHEHHPDDEPGHETPCTSGCAAPDESQGDLFEVTC